MTTDNSVKIGRDKIYVYIFYIIYILQYIYNIRNETPKILNSENGFLSFVVLSFCRIFAVLTMRIIFTQLSQTL